MPSKKDYLGQALTVGDAVIIIAKGYRELRLATVTGETPQYIYVEYQPYLRGDKEKMRQLPTQVIKVEGPHVTMHVLSKG